MMKLVDMIQRLPSIPYPPSREGFWSPVTSTINWCEEDYYATVYSAEIVNSMTNLIFAMLGLKGVMSCWKYGHHTVFLVSFFGYLMVGTGSFMFHNPMQLVDELSMIYTTCLMCYACFSFDLSRRFSQLLAIGLVGLSIFITGYYHYLQDPSFHQNAYTILTAIVLFRSMYVMEINLRPSLRLRYGILRPVKVSQPSTESELALTAEKDRKILARMWWMISVGSAVFLGGFVFWSLDNKYCSVIRQWRHEVGLPWGILLEGHGWWHLMTGFGAYMYITWNIWLRHCLNGRQDDYDLKWPTFFSFPEIVATPPKDEGWKWQNGNSRPKLQRKPVSKQS